VQQKHDLPMYLVSLVSFLVTPVTDQAGDAKFVYKSAKEVLADLQLAANDPDVYLKALRWADFAERPLILDQGSFFGRKTELALIRHALDVVMKGDSKPCAIVVSGYPGAG
jgi:hypothetical protein